MPELWHVASIDDLALFGLDGSNYGRFVYDEARWEASFGFRADGLRRAELTPRRPPGGAVPPAGAVRTVEQHGVRLSVAGAYRGYRLPKPYDSFHAVDTELIVLAVAVENVASPVTSFARRDFHLRYDKRGTGRPGVARTRAARCTVETRA